MNFVDLHTHLAWGIDDGYPTKEDTIKALVKMANQNVKYVVSTPHFIPGQTKEVVENMNRRIQELQQLAKQYNITIIKGCELFLNHDYLEMLDQKLVNTIGDTNYLLAEFNVTRKLGSKEDVEERLYELTVRGYQVVVAHVERYFHEKMDIERVRNWVNEGYVIQMNTSSLLGIHGSQVQKNAIALLDEGLVHVIGTDTHRPDGKRDPNLDQAYQWLCDHYSKKTADLLCCVNGVHILNGEPVETLEPVQKSFFKKLFKRR